MGRAVPLRGPAVPVLRDDHRAPGPGLAVRRLRHPLGRQLPRLAARRSPPLVLRQSVTAATPAEVLARQRVRRRPGSRAALPRPSSANISAALAMRGDGHLPGPGDLTDREPCRPGSGDTTERRGIGTKEHEPCRKSRDWAPFTTPADIQLVCGTAGQDGTAALRILPRGDVLLRLRELLPSVRRRPDHASSTRPRWPGCSTRISWPAARLCRTPRPTTRSLDSKMVSVTPGRPGHRRLDRRPVRELQLGAAVPHPGDDRGAPQQQPALRRGAEVVSPRLRPDQHRHERAAAGAVLEVLRVPRATATIQNINTLLALLSTPDRSLTRRRSRPRPTSSPATTRSWPIRSSRTSSPAPGRAPTSGTW